MKNPFVRTLVPVLAGSFLLCTGALAVEIASPTGLSVRLDEANGSYELRWKNTGWRLAGRLGVEIKKPTARSGADRIGSYQEIGFEWQRGPLAMRGAIRLYDGRPLALFSDTCASATELPPEPFPSFTNVPADLHVFSYQQNTFAPPQFKANECSTPWLLFNDRADALIISPASHFMVASMLGDGSRRIASGFNPHLRNLPAGFTQQTLLSFEQGINRAWDLWGRTLTTLEGATRPGNEADTVLKYFGYWTDNGAYYYYNYDPARGYAGTLEALVDRYRSEKIPMHYLQLDSWWYKKSFTGDDGVVGTTKAPRFPAGEWNRYGGLLEYRPDPFLFPDGLGSFQKTIGLPLVTHNRWIDPASPYHQHYKISGLAAVDPKWWSDIADYLKSSGVVTYEQDWCDRIYKYSPAFSSTVDTAGQFLDEMAGACARDGLTMQYCMPYPCYFLQGARYANLTTIRTSDDRFQPGHWNNFLYVSRFAGALGIWPWADVFNSTETNNLLLATLSAGPVGTGDAIGRENKDNLFKSVRADGVIVKPDAPIVPLDRCYVADAQQQAGPLIAATYSASGNLRTEYVFAFNRPKTGAGTVRFTPRELGYSNNVCVYEYFKGAARQLTPDSEFSEPLAAGAVGYYIIAPLGRSGIAFLGDEGKFVSAGRQRIVSLEDDSTGLTAKVAFARGEQSVTLHGYADAAPRVSVQSGRAGSVEYDAASRHFRVTITANAAASVDQSGSDAVRTVTVRFETRPAAAKR